MDVECGYRLSKTASDKRARRLTDKFRYRLGRETGGAGVVDRGDFGGVLRGDVLPCGT